MPKIVFIEHDGSARAVDAENGANLMQVALDNMVPGILGACGGGCACATCHGYIDLEYIAKIPTMTELEDVALGSVSEIRRNSRLICQIQVTDELDNLVIRLPADQF